MQQKPAFFMPVSTSFTLLQRMLINTVQLKTVRERLIPFHLKEERVACLMHCRFCAKTTGK